MNKEKKKVFNRNILIVLTTIIVLAGLLFTSNSMVLARIGGIADSPAPNNSGVSNEYGYGGDGGGPLPSGTTDITGLATTAGVFISTVTATSVDGECVVHVPTGTVGLTADLKPITQISIVPMTTPPAPPEDTSVIGLTYNLGPEGATFDPPITVSFTYDPTKLPAGVNEEDLSIAVYDKNTGTWVKLTNIKVDPITHTISGETSHFTAFSIVAYLASFSLSSLTISPSEAKIGEAINISVDITNIGDVAGDYNVVLMIDDVQVSAQAITLAGQASQEVTFITTKSDAGTYLVKIGTLSGSLIVKAPTQASTQTPTNWSLIGGLIAAAVVIIGLLMYFLWWRRRLA